MRWLLITIFIFVPIDDSKEVRYARAPGGEYFDTMYDCVKAEQANNLMIQQIYEEFGGPKPHKGWSMYMEYRCVDKDTDPVN